MTAVFHLQGRAFCIHSPFNIFHSHAVWDAQFQFFFLRDVSETKPQWKLIADRFHLLVNITRLFFPIVKQRSYSECSVGGKRSRPIIGENCWSRALNFPPSELHHFVWPSFSFAVATRAFAIVSSGKFLPNGPSVTLHVKRCRHKSRAIIIRRRISWKLE